MSYKNLTPGKEYTVKGILMNKATGKPLVIDGEEIRASYTFKPETSDGEVTVTFTFDAGGLKRQQKSLCLKACTAKMLKSPFMRILTMTGRR